MISFRRAAVVCVLLAVSAVAQSRPSLNAEQSQAEAAHFLADLIRIDTQDPPGNESKVADYLQGVLKKEGIDSEILETVPGRASIVARLKGNGSKRPLLLMGHEDVVPVDRSHWTVDPFAALEKDGMLWGRGASDDKAMVAANLEVFLQLKRMKIPLSRDVILFPRPKNFLAAPDSKPLAPAVTDRSLASITPSFISPRPSPKPAHGKPRLA